MRKHLLITALAGALLAALPAHAQDAGELDGAPPPLNVPRELPKPAPRPPAPKPAPVQPSATATTSAARLKAEETRLARLAEAQKAEATRLATQADNLKAEQERLDARAAALATEERRLAQLRTEQEASHARKLAELEQPRAAPAPRQVAAPAQPPPPVYAPRPQRVRITYDDARRACTRAGMSEAVDLDFRSARYETAPHFFERERELRGLMRMDDRRGYLLVDTVCALDDAGAVEHFELLR
jgi:hypothetical protein